VRRSIAVGAAARAGYMANPRPYKRRYNYPLLVQLQQGLGERLTKRSRLYSHDLPVLRQPFRADFLSEGVMDPSCVH
jgi:hypothetical protein